MGRILIVDDGPAARTALSALLCRHGHEVREAASGEEALEALGEGEFDLVITDLPLPDMDCVLMLRAARESDPDLELIVVSASGTQAEDAMELGAFAHFEEHFDPDRLALAVVRALERRSLRREVRSLRQALAEELGLAEPEPASGSQSDRLADVEREHILSVLERHDGNRSAAARALGIGRNTLWRRLKEYGVSE